MIGHRRHRVSSSSASSGGSRRRPTFEELFGPETFVGPSRDRAAPMRAATRADGEADTRALRESTLRRDRLIRLRSRQASAELRTSADAETTRFLDLTETQPVAPSSSSRRTRVLSQDVRNRHTRQHPPGGDGDHLDIALNDYIALATREAYPFPTPKRRKLYGTGYDYGLLAFKYG
ncbi:hypothetical protein LTR16_007877, partial [Cryomyces antarcticus]